jgi:hypothetical protein
MTDKTISLDESIQELIDTLKTTSGEMGYAGSAYAALRLILESLEGYSFPRQKASGIAVALGFIEAFCEEDLPTPEAVAEAMREGYLRRVAAEVDERGDVH